MIFVHFKNWYENLLERERKIFLVGIAFVGILFIYAVCWNPLSTAVSDYQTEVHSQQQLLRYLQQATQTIQALRASGIHVNTTDDSISLFSMVEQTLATQQLSSFLKQVQQPKTNQVSLTFEKVPCDQLMQWMEMLVTSRGVQVMRLSADRLPVVGTANVTMVLEIKN